MTIDINISADSASGIPEAANVVIALLALIVAATSIFLTWRSLKGQERHNRLSVTPMPQIAVGDYENSLFVRIDNNGPGPLIIKDLEVLGGVKKAGDIISLMPALPSGMAWRDYVSGLAGRAIEQGSSLVLISLSGDPEEKSFSDARDICRLSLAKLTVRLTYTDVYGSSFDPCERALTWFARSKT